MPRGILFIGGRGPDSRQVSSILRDDDIICAADSGLDAALNAGIRPDGIVGDMDSLSNPELLADFPEDCVRRYPMDKDETDTDLGLLWLAERGCRERILIGGGEGRLDHTLALLGLFWKAEAPEIWYTALEEIRPIISSCRLSGRPGDLISFASAGSGPWKIESTGLKWPLKPVAWSEGAQSLSNRFTGNEVTLNPQSGRFLCTRPLGDSIPPDSA